MKVLAVCGSHRKGNTEWMLKKLLERVTENGVEAELILLRKANIKMCLGCLVCEEGGKDRKGICKIKDDMNAIYPKLLEADCLVFGTPAYFDLLSGLEVVCAYSAISIKIDLIRVLVFRLVSMCLILIQAWNWYRY